MDIGAPLPPGLYVVATPIGNLHDISARAINTLRNSDVIAAEDTRVTRNLLSHLGISASPITLHEHNERKVAQDVVEWVVAGKSVALVCDAGTPAISDPGALVVERILKGRLPMFAIPGASSLTAALSVSGFQFDGVLFRGFLPSKGAERRACLEELASTHWAITLFESPHRILKTISDLWDALGEREVVICREITKKFESVTRLNLSAAKDWISADPNRQRGEFVLVIEARAIEKKPALDPEHILKILLAEMPVKGAVSVTAKLTGARKNEIYDLALRLKDAQ